jgi:general stress protein 26
MAAYGVPADPADVLPWAWAQERLVRNRNYWVVTASAAARPHALPVWGVWLPETDRFWFSCSPTSRKFRNIAENPQCAVTIDDTVECVSVEGLARIADPGQDADEMIAAYLAKYWADPEVHAEMEAFVRAHAIVEVTPDRAFGIIEREDEFASRATRWRW